MLGTLSDVMGMVVKVPELTEMSSMEQVIHVLIHSSNNRCCHGAKFSARYSNKKEGRYLSLEAEILTLSPESWETLFLNA